VDVLLSPRARKAPSVGSGRRAPGFPAALALLLPALTGAGGCARHAAREGTGKATEVRVKADTVVIGERTVAETVLVTGVLAADRRTDLSANATGRVVRTFVERGDHVAAGEILAQLDSRSAALSKAEAKANEETVAEQLRAVRTDCARSEALLAKGAISQAEYDKTSSQCRSQSSSEEAARARAAEAARALGDSSIRAPFAGVVGERFVSVGDYVRPFDKVVTLLAIDSLRLKLSVPERAIGAAHEGSVVTFETVSMPGRVYTGTIRYLGREVREGTRDLIDEAVVDNHDGSLVPGMFVTAHLPTGESTRPIVPKSALVPVEPAQAVFVVADGRLQERVVETSTAIDDGVAVLDGVKKGERVVVHPTPDMLDGMSVE
jgi:RND family efflux transporter MFP subunit